MAPPSTTRLVPVTNLDASEARYKAAHPISSGCPNFFMGVLPIIRCARPGSSALEYLSIGVSVHPGTIALNRMPVPDSSDAKERIMPSVPDLAMEYPNVTEEGARFEIGVPRILKHGTDVALFAAGYMTGVALEAAKELEGSISVRVINVSTIKPMNKEVMRKMAEGCRAVVTAEEHNVAGGLGSAVAEALCEDPLPMKMVGIKDTFGCSGHNYQEVLAYHGLTKEAVAEAVRAMAG